MKKPIRDSELYQHLGDFLKSRGIELKDGSYTKRIQQGCGLLADAINLSQSGLEKAKTEASRKLEQVRQVIHEKTAPKAPPVIPTPVQPGKPARKPATARPARPATTGRKGTKSRR